MASMAKPISESLNLTDFIMKLVIDDITDEDAVSRTRDTEGASMSWIVGHLLHYRHQMMRMLGEDIENPYAEQFGEVGASDGSDYPAVAELRRAWIETAGQVSEVVSSATDEQLKSPLPSGSPHGERTVLDILVFYMWHESYHMGQFGTIRAQLGYKPTAQLAVEATATQH